MESKKIIKIEISDPVYCLIKQGFILIKPALTYKAEYYVQGPYSKKRVDYKKTLAWKSRVNKGYLFYHGLLNRVKEYCQTQNLNLEIKKTFEDYLIPETDEPKVPGLNIKEGERAYQYSLIQKAIKHQRGVILSATGSGKTIMMLGLISCFPSKKILFLSNTHVPITQFKKSVIKYGFKDYEIDSGTVQTYSRKPAEEIDKYDIIIVDECHEFGGFNGMYANLFRKSLAPIRVGFTATLPDNPEIKFALEGLIGPVIGSLSIEEGNFFGVLAKPHIKVLELPEQKKIGDIRLYRDVYRMGVVNNRARNLAIVQETKRLLDEGKTILILVVEIEHGKNIVDLAKRLYDLNITFVQGKTDSEAREEIRMAMNEKKIKAVVATAVFRKALDIPSLSAVINACGGKSETMTLQAIGRGLRKTKDKNEVEIIDFFDPSHHYLVKHFGYRLCMYFREKWI